MVSSRTLSLMLRYTINVKSGLMDAVGLDTVQHIEEHYIQERKLPSYHLDYLKTNFIEKGKLGLKTREKGGLYPPPTPGSQTKLLFLNMGASEPLKGKTTKEIFNSGQVLSYNIDTPGARPVELVDNLYMPDGIDIANSTGMTMIVIFGFL